MIVVTGVSGQLGSAFRRRLGGGARYLDQHALDLTNVAAIRPTIEELSPALVINCAAYTAVDRAEGESADISC